MPYQIDYVGDFRVVFDYFFPGVFTFGMAEAPEVEDYADWENIYLPRIAGAIGSRPLKAFRLFNITDVAIDVFNPETFVEPAGTLLFYNIMGAYDLTQKAGGMPYENRYTWYPASWRLNRRVERVVSDSDARQYLVDYYQPKGELQVPLVALHTLWDPAVPYHHEEIYQKRVWAAGSAENFTLLPVFSYGHCNFEPWQVLGAFYLLLAQAAW
jgi:hypothetical protein